MKRYYAYNGSFKIGLARSALMDEFLAQGYSIWEIDDHGAERQIADPETGFYDTPPVFPAPEKASFSSPDDLGKALNIILGEED